VHLGRGDFINEIVTLNGNIALSGQGDDSVLTGGIIINKPSDADKVVSNITLENFKVDPDKGVTPIIAWSNYDGKYNTENLTITGITIVADGQHGLGLFDVSDATLTDLHISLESADPDTFYGIEAIGLFNAK